MAPPGITPDELLAALDAFKADRELTKGQAIRILVTEGVVRHGYLESDGQGKIGSEKPVYRSENGDDWLLATDTAGNISIVHRGNVPSGGMRTETPLAEFLALNGDSPEGRAIREAVNSGKTSVF